MYKVNDLVFYEHDVKGKGVGKVVVVDGDETYLVHSPNIDGHNARGQDNTNNYWFCRMNLKPFEKRVGQRYKFIGIDNEFDDGDIVTLIDIHADRLSEYGDEDGSHYLHDIDYDFERYGGTPDLEYLDEGVDNNRPPLEVGMVIGFELDDGAQSSEMRIITEYDVKDYQSRTSINRVYKPRENGDLELIWEREQLYTLQCPLTNQYLSKLTPDIENLFWVDVDWDKFTKEETIKIGEHLDWKEVK